MSIESDRKIIEAATPGPWKQDTVDPGDVVVWGPGEDEFIANIGHTEWVAYDLDPVANATFIATARNRWPLYVRLAEAVRAYGNMECDEHDGEWCPEIEAAWGKVSDALREIEEGG